MSIPFVKMHGAGNDFVVLRPEGERDWAQLAQEMCERRFGIGSDGLILVLPSDKADLRMRMFNPDGSEAEMCGNGIRCFAKYAYERGLTPEGKTRLSVETGAGVLGLEVEAGGGKVERVRAGMGEPRLLAAEIPVLVEAEGPVIEIPIEVDGQDIKLTCVSMGNPHAVLFINSPVAEYPLEKIGPQVERHPLFPKRVNFEVAQIVGRELIEARVWERGAGLTLACGSGACATMVAARLQHLVGDVVDVSLPGGILTVEWPGQGEVTLVGPAVEVFTGVWPE